MKKLLALIFVTLAIPTIHSQQFEIGPSFGYGFVNIVDSKSKEDRAVIGDALWNTNFGVHAVYYFKNPIEQTTARIGLLYRNGKRGSISETDPSNTFEFQSHTIGLFAGAAGNIGHDFLFYLDIGFGSNSLDTSNFYKGNLTHTVAFGDLDAPLEIKSHEVTFLYAIGIEKDIIQNRLKLFIEVHGDAGISKLNKNDGSYRSQSLGFGMGLRYVFDRT